MTRTTRKRAARSAPAMSEIVRVRLPDELFAALRERAATGTISISTAARQILARELTAAESAKRAA